MELWINLLKVLDTQMETPKPYGWFHLLWLAAVIILSVLLCTRYRDVSRKQIRKVVFGMAMLVAVRGDLCSRLYGCRRLDIDGGCGHPKRGLPLQCFINSIRNYCTLRRSALRGVAFGMISLAI